MKAPFVVQRKGLVLAIAMRPFSGNLSTKREKLFST